MIPLPLVLEAYRSGYFPMAVEGQIRWFSPDPRAIIPLDGFHVPRRLARTVRQRRFEIHVNRSFDEVIRACATGIRDDEDERDEAGSWIDSTIIETYEALHEAGLAHSVEAWFRGQLAGGLYGVALGGAFFGESMFSRVRDASKVALVALVERLRARGFRLLDTQWITPHLEQFGAIEIPRRRYLDVLRSISELERRFD